MNTHWDMGAVRARIPDLLAPYVRALAIGDLLPDLSLRDERGRPLSLFEDAFAGKPILLLVCGKLSASGTRDLLAKLARRQAGLEAQGAEIIALTSDSDARAAREAKREFQLDFPICGDATGSILAQLGLCKGADLPGRLIARLITIAPTRQVMSVTDIDTALDASEHTIGALGADAEAGVGWIPGHAPVLIVPNVLDAQDCAALIDHFEQSGALTVAKPDDKEAFDYKFPVYDHHRQDRIDHVIKDRALLERLDQRLQSRLIPMIAKAFAFQVTRREHLHIARYEGARDGIEIGHRDNVSPGTAYRRFALSISLNDDYEGGELVFGEFAQKGYRGAPGTALVFSSSLLHEIKETTWGVRYNLISHLFNDQALPGARS